MSFQSGSQNCALLPPRWRVDDVVPNGNDTTFRYFGIAFAAIFIGLVASKSKLKEADKEFAVSIVFNVS